MTASLVRLELRRTRVQLVAFSITVAILGIAVTAVYPTVLETIELFDPFLDMVPKGMLEAFEMSGGIAGVGAYFGSQFFQVWVLVAAIFAIALGTRGAAGEAAAGTIEIPLSAPVSRARYLLATIAVQVIGLAALAVVGVLSVVLVGPLIDVAFDVAAFTWAGVLSFAFGCAIAGVSCLAAVLTLDRGRSMGFAAIVLILMYLVITIALLEPSIEALKYLSAFHYYRPAGVIDEGRVPAGELVLFGAVALAGWGLAVWRFRSRDLVA